MTVLDRYLFREFLHAVAACILGFLLLFLLIDFVDHAEKLLRHNASLREIGWYYLTRVPGMFVLISPVGTMLAVLVAVSLRVRSNELTAIFSGGISLVRACLPILAGCALVSALSLLSSEVLAPAANRHAREFEPVRRIESRRARRLPDGAWELGEGRERILGETPSIATFSLRTYRFPETMDGFIAGDTPPEEMTYAQLSGYVRELRRKGFEAKRYATDLHAKIAYPLLNVLISMLAIPFALRSPRSGGVWRSIGLGLLVGFACWVVLSTSLSMGRKGMLPALLAAWLPGLLFVGSGAALFRGVGR